MAFKFKKSKRKYHKRKGIGLKLKKQTVYTVAAIWFWLFAGAICLSFFGEGSMLSSLRESLSGRFGWVMYVLPVFLVSASTLFFKVKSDLGNQNVPMGLGVMIFGLLSLTRAGDIGDMLWVLTADAIAAEGATLLFLGVVLIGFIILFNTSLDRFINFLLMGMQTILEWFASLGNRPQKTQLIIGGTQPKEALKIRGSEEDKPLLKKPMTPPPVPNKNVGSSKEAGATGNLTMANLNNSQDMKLWEYPDVNILSDGPGEKADRGDVRKNADVIEKTLDSFGIQADVTEVNPGPAVTQYAIKLSLGTKVSKITSLASDMALALAAPTGQVRIEAPIPGRDLVGIEIPNRGLEFVTLKRMLLADPMKKAKSKLSVAMGLDVSGNPLVGDIGKMPHVLVAGTTGSGKSVLLNSWICTLLYRTTPAEVRLILVDPKRVELVGYNGVPHLLTPVIVETDKILSALRWATQEMERRYKQFAEVGVRNLDGFNELSGFQALPYIVIIIDELADLMAYAPVEVEDTICRIAQMARATGIHLVLATQRPSVDVITGLIKANIPARIAFNVSSMMDSRVIIDTPGAEKLLGRGDMLYVPPDQAKPMRIQGTFVSDKEVTKVVEFFKNTQAEVHYTEEVLSQPATAMKKGGVGGSADGKDQLFEDALRLVCQYDKASASLLQRRLSVGYARAARILDQLEMAGIIGAGEGSKPRDVLIKNPDEYLASQQKAQAKES
ncbi:DNA translocase FtsK [Candidatus Gottesmanbacteria bacterium]|nr:DNA translocase FtsK [Candidatus Gottesmanbacteria bacterium]